MALVALVMFTPSWFLESNFCSERGDSCKLRYAEVTRHGPDPWPGEGVALQLGDPLPPCRLAGERRHGSAGRT